VVREAATHRAVLLQFQDDARAAGLAASALIGSPIVGADGNREFLVGLGVGEAQTVDWTALVDSVAPSPV
jgi:predicted rRNA methylase YqxC with S4 and FtsJ domains